MLINRTPLRVSLLGGGTDLPAFFESNDFGRVLSFAISKYVYISIHPLVEDSRILLKYSKQEFVENYDQLQHPIARAVLRELQIKGVDIGISSDIPSGTGMGSSSAFTVGFYGLCHAFKGTFSSALDLARMACKLEIEELNSPIGKQDQYACALGGINQIDFYPNGSVTAQPLKIEKEVIAEFERHLLLIRVGKTRSASGQLKIQNEILRSRSLSNIEGKYVELRNLVEVGTSVLIKGDFKTLGSLIKQSWEIKKTLSPNVSNLEIDDLMSHLQSMGVYGAKLLGAGTSGYVLVVANHDTLAKIREIFGNSILSPTIDFGGHRIVYANE